MHVPASNTGGWNFLSIDLNQNDLRKLREQDSGTGKEILVIAGITEIKILVQKIKRFK
jgi:hypothetical protein